MVFWAFHRGEHVPGAVALAVIFGISMRHASLLHRCKIFYFILLREKTYFTQYDNEKPPGNTVRKSLLHHISTQRPRIRWPSARQDVVL